MRQDGDRRETGLTERSDRNKEAILKNSQESSKRGKVFMDWDFKMPSWDLPDLERGVNPNIGSVVGLSGLEMQRKKGDCSVDLKLGRLGDFTEGSSHKWKNSKPSPMLQPQGPSKRPRGPSNGASSAMCSVDGCKSDLSNSKDYHRRHKVCEVHAKTPKVLVGGQEQRFCQQCSRYEIYMLFVF